MVLKDKLQIPVAIIVAPANRHESQLLEESLGNIRFERPHPKEGTQKVTKKARFKEKRWTVEGTNT